MSEPKAELKALAERAAGATEDTRPRLKKLSSSGRRRMIMPYRGFGSSEGLTLAGRVILDQSFASSVSERDSRWRNLVEFYKRLESDEVGGARVRYRFQGIEDEIATDSEGYFHVDITPAAPVAPGTWHEVELELVATPTDSMPFHATAPVMVPSIEARFGVISDIDDTVLQSAVMNKLRMLLLTALSNARTRKPFPGVSGLYRALERGAGGAEGNPIFYVSGSPWNLYEPIIEFLEVQKIPAGPLLLRDFGMHALFSGTHNHKLGSIERILAAYPRLPFVLIGDSGEKDPEIYTEVVKRHPSRIRAIYIRSVNQDPARIAAIGALIAEVRKLETQLVLAPDSEFAAAHAAAEGLIAAGDWSAVHESKEKDETAPSAASLARVTHR